MIEFTKVSELISLRSHVTVIALQMPLYAALFYAGYLLLIDNESPLTITYQAAKFSSCDATTREEAEGCAIDEAVSGSYVYLWRELCLKPGYPSGESAPAWETETISYNSPRRRWYNRTGCYGHAFPLETPKLALTRDYLYTNEVTFPVNILVHATTKLPPVPLRLVAPTLGRPGPTGPAGPTGDTGRTGDTGLTGPKGESGKVHLSP